MAASTISIGAGVTLAKLSTTESTCPHRSAPTGSISRLRSLLYFSRGSSATQTAKVPSHGSNFVNSVRANGDRPDGLALHVKGRSQVGGDVHRIDRAAIMRGQPVNFVCPQALIEWVLFEDLKG